MALPRDSRKRILARMVQGNGWTRGAELGVLKGDTFLHLLRMCPQLYLVGVDLWEAQPGKEMEPGGRSYSDHDLAAYLWNLQKKIPRYGARAQLLRMPTADAAARFADGHFDFVFIDADHTYRGVSADIDAWKPKVRMGGWLMGHDYNAKRFPGVVQAVDERFGKPWRFADHVWAVPC